MYRMPCGNVTVIVATVTVPPGADEADDDDGAADRDDEGAAEDELVPAAKGCPFTASVHPATASATIPVSSTPHTDLLRTTACPFPHRPAPTPTRPPRRRFATAWHAAHVARRSAGVAHYAVLTAPTAEAGTRHSEDEQAPMVARDAALTRAPSPERLGPTRVLLIEDDDGDALLVEELLIDVGAAVELQRVRSLAEARPYLAGVACVLLDLGLPDTHELEGVRWLQAHRPDVAVVVLTGLADEYLGEHAVRAGAQDYLVKGQVDGQLLDRVIRYAIERVRSEEVQRELREARIYAEENTRLERGLLPSPLVSDPELTVASRYSPGGQRLLLGGDFYDVVQAADGWVHAVVGDVCGHGPDEAALGVSMRVAWRTMVLAARPTVEVLTTLDQVFAHERHKKALFTTLTMLSIDPSRRFVRVYLAGHPPPLVITPGGVRQLEAPLRPPVGIGDGSVWPSADLPLDRRWSILMYTDGLIEGRIGAGSRRLDVDGLLGLVESVLPAGYPARGAEEGLLDDVIERVRALNGGDLDDDLAVLALGGGAR